ncbi:MAG TPA: dethiobiotin synthase [Lacipirellulaceae bacterium]|jgi:dethiobiotin synthetase|nr:dethiobiotin synthase [Lacipirellulaceae bacterium]
MARGLFITGTGTGVGKTYVAALIARALRNSGLRVGVYKPVASGCELQQGELVSPDALSLWTAAGEPGTLEEVCPQRFAAPLAPHLAARAEGRRVDTTLLRRGMERWRETSDVVLVEGAGGLMSPISDEDYNADLADAFGYPLIVVAANELGTINATLQTLIAATTYGNGLSIAGVVLNSPQRLATDPSIDSNPDELSRRCVPPLLALVDHATGFDRPVDWASLANAGRNMTQ